MPRSMTGFGQAQRSVKGYEVRLEIKSVNHRYLEVVFRFPRQWAALEEPLKKRIQQLLVRGRVEVFLSVERDVALPLEAEINWPLADSCFEASRQIQDRYQLEQGLNVRDLFLIPDLIRFREAGENNAELEEAIADIVQEAVSRLIQMREREGADLLADMKKRLFTLRQHTFKLISEAPLVAQEYRRKLTSRLQEWLGESPLDEQRIAMEAAILADKADIDEELTRLESHFEHFDQILQGQEAAGRKLDFLLQEMNREVNTIGSKANSASIAGMVVQMKSELEKIREQVQNIE